MPKVGSMVWATRASDGTAVHVTEVKRGLACGCTCPGCNAVLEAVNSENLHWDHRPHFRHHKSPELEDCSTTALVRAAQAAISGIDSFLLPGLSVDGTATSPDGKVFTETVHEPAQVARIAGYEFVDTTDAVLTLSGGQQIYVRLVAARIAPEGLPAKQGAMAEVAIDISDPVLRTADAGVLRQHISLNLAGRIWCHHQRTSELRAKALDLAKRRAAEHWAARPSATPTTSVPVEPGQRPDSLGPIAPSPRLAVNSPGNGSSYTWTRGQLPTDRSAEIRRVRRLYKDGAYRHYAPRINYDDVLLQARQARAQGRDLPQLFETWRTAFNLGDDLKPITSVLLVAGLVRTVAP